MNRLLNKIYWVNDEFHFDYWSSEDGKNHHESFKTMEGAEARQIELAGYKR